MRKGGGHYRVSRHKVRVHYKQQAVASHYEYVPTQRVVVYEPHLVYAPKVVYTPQVVYKKKVVRKVKRLKQHAYHTRPSYRAAPAPTHYEGPVMTTEEAVHRDYDGHGILVYRPVKRGHKRKYRRKHQHKRRAHGSYKYPPVLPAYHPEPKYHYGEHQPVQVYVVKRRRIRKKTPIFGSKSVVRHKTVRGRYRKVRHRRAHRTHKKHTH